MHIFERMLHWVYKIACDKDMGKVFKKVLCTPLVV